MDKTLLLRMKSLLEVGNTISVPREMWSEYISVKETIDAALSPTAPVGFMGGGSVKFGEPIPAGAPINAAQPDQNPEARPATREAESQAPTLSELGDAGVAPSHDSGVPDNNAAIEMPVSAIMPTPEDAELMALQYMADSEYWLDQLGAEKHAAIHYALSKIAALSAELNLMRQRVLEQAKHAEQQFKRATKAEAAAIARCEAICDSEISKYHGSNVEQSGCRGAIGYVKSEISKLKGAP